MTFRTFTTPKYIAGLEMNTFIAAETIPCSHCGQGVSVWRPATLEDLEIYIKENPTPTSGNSDIISSGDDYRPTHDDIYAHTARYREGKWSMSMINMSQNYFTPGEVFLAVKK